MLFGLHNQARELRSKKVPTRAGKGRSMANFQQVYEGVPVLGGEINVQPASNELLVANGEALPGISLGTEPGVALTARQRPGEAHQGPRPGAGELDVTGPELWIFDPTLLGGPGLRYPSGLAHGRHTPRGLDDFRELVLVDAQLGGVALNFNQVHDARGRLTYEWTNTSAIPGGLVCNDPTRVRTGLRRRREARPPLRRRNLRLLRGQARTRQPRRRRHENDIDPDYCGSPPNCPMERLLGRHADGLRRRLAAADDVVGHELTHGVTDSSPASSTTTRAAPSTSPSPTLGRVRRPTNTSGTDTAPPAG